MYVSESPGTRPFPAPDAILTRDKCVLNLDAIYVADFSDETDSYAVSRALAANRSAKVGLFHWPAFRRKPGPLTSTYFELTNKFGAIAVVSGQRVSTSEVIFADANLLDHPVDSCFLLEGPASVTVIDGDTGAQSTLSNLRQLIPPMMSEAGLAPYRALRSHASA